jgi:hypothetical protein
MGFIRKIGDSSQVIRLGVMETSSAPAGFEYWPGSPPDGYELVRLSKLSPGEAMAHIAALILPLPDALKTVLMPAIGTLRSSLEFGDVGYVTRQIEAMAQSLPPEVAPVMAAILEILDNTQEGAA